MYPKSFRRFLKKLLQFLYMALVKRFKNGPDVADHIYKFKAFNYQKIKHCENGKVPFARSGHRIGADSANFYSFGGYNPLSQNDVNEQPSEDYYPLFQELWRFNFASRKWTRFPNSRSLPAELVSNALLLHRNYLMVYGGTGSPFGFRCSNQLYVCKVNDISGEMVEVQATGQWPLPLYGQALIFHNDFLYTIGGTTGLSYTCDIHRLNMKTMEWEIVYICNGQGDFEPEGRYRHEVGFDGKFIYVLGGGTAEDVYDFQNIPAFNTEKKEWNRQKTVADNQKGIPASRRCHGAVQIATEKGGVQVFVTGGHDGENIFDDLWRLDLKSFRWTYFETCRLPNPTYFHAAAVTPEGRLYVFGGIYSVDEDVARNNSIYSTWLSIPKLSEMCWEAVLHYSPHVVNCKSDDLIDMGLPRHFVQRLQ